MGRQHPYRAGNYAPQMVERTLAPCVVHGAVPAELARGMYVRNGSNPAGATGDEDSSVPYHWFDGDGMLQGVYFSTKDDGSIVPLFVNKFVLTDVFLAASDTSNRPILPSIATLLAPLSGLPTLLATISRAVSLAAISRLGDTPVERLSVANTAVLYHDGRALASCESGPLSWIRLPALETVGWWDLEGDSIGQVGMREKGGTLGWMKEWTTAHPKRDPITKELILFHSSFLPPYLHYSCVPSTATYSGPATPRILSAPVPIPHPRMMHDCAASATHSILLDMPLSLDPTNLVKGRPVVAYSPTTPMRFGVFPRHEPEAVRWYEAPSCVIFHTALAFDSPTAVNLVCCQLNSARLVYEAGNLDIPLSQLLPPGKEDTCQLYYYRFPFDDGTVSHAFPLSAVPFEFPAVPFHKSMTAARYVYGCTMRSGSFSVALGSAAKIDCLVKMDVAQLIARGKVDRHGPEDPVDARTVLEVLEDQVTRVDVDERSPVRIFGFPPGIYAQECSFVPRENQRGEDDGFLLTYVFDESQLDARGCAPASSTSELWIIDAWGMEEVIAKIQLPQRVPYGLHGNWFTPDEIDSQRTVSNIRSRPAPLRKGEVEREGLWEELRRTAVKFLD